MSPYSRIQDLALALREVLQAFGFVAPDTLDLYEVRATARQAPRVFRNCAFGVDLVASVGQLLLTEPVLVIVLVAHAAF